MTPFEQGIVFGIAIACTMLGLGCLLVMLVRGDT